MTVPPQRPSSYASPRFFVLASAILASAMGFIDGTIVAIALPQMRAQLDASFVQAQWIASSYVLMLSGLILLGGSMGDRIGVRRAFSIGIVAFVIASIACAVAQTAEQLIAFRTLKGIGAAVMIPGSMALIAVNVPREERGAAMGIWVAASSITTAFGPMLGGLLLTHGDGSAWRWIFAINLPLGAIVLVMLYTKVRDDHLEHEEVESLVDWAGIVLSVLSLGLLAGGLTALGEADAGGVAPAMIIAGLVMAAITVVVELKKRDPIIPVELFANRAFAGANAFTLLAWMPIAGVVFFLPMVLIVGWQLPPSYAGAMFIPMSLLIAVCSPIAGRMADRFGTLPLLVGGGVVLALSCVALATAVYHQNFWLGVLPALTVMGGGMGLVASPMSTAIMNSVDDRQVGAASGINNMIARMANLFAIAGLGALVAFVYAMIVRAGNVPDIIRDGLLEAGFGERLVGGLYVEPAVRLQMVAMDHAMIALCLVLAMLCLVASTIAWLSLSKLSVEAN
ncbi:MAG: MFS transporter [Pseudomonadota bacterium]